MLKIGILVFPQVEELDFVGPFEVLSYINKIQPESTEVSIIAETLEPIQCFNGLRVLPDITFEQCPQLDVLVIPGGKGRLSAMVNKDIRQFIMGQARNCKYITSVCTGAFLLAEAGLLKGKKATTYHTALDELASYQETKVERNTKVVQDGQIITAAGVSSGIELGLYLLKVLFNPIIAQKVADSIEYYINVEEI